MELSDLKVFLAIAEEGSISGAAERLDYVQSNVTARIRKFETELGVSLFHRHPKGVTLTDKGIAFREYATTILNLADESLRVVRETTYPSGPLVIGVVDTVNCVKFMKALSDYQSEHPSVSLSVITGNSAELLAKVMNHQLDGAFVTGPVKSAKLTFEYAMEDEIKWLTRSKEEPCPDLARTKWAVAPKGCPFRAILEEWLRREQLPLHNMIEISSLEAQLSCVRSGLASTLLPESVLFGDYTKLGAFPIPAEYRFTQTNLVRRTDRFSTKAFSAFVEKVKAERL